MRLRTARTRLAKTGAGLVLGLALLVACAHLPPVRARVLSMAFGALAPYGVEGQAERLDYNVLTLRMRVSGLSLAAKGRADAPFFQAREVELSLPWSAAWRGLAIDSLRIVAPRVHVARAPDGLLNLPSLPDRSQPAAGEQASSGPTAIGIERLEIRNLAASFADLPAALDVEISGVRLDLKPVPGGRTAGALTLAGTGRLRWRGHETRLRTLEGRLVLDGTRVSLEDMRLVLDEVDLRASGEIGVLEAVPDLDVEYDATVDLRRASMWFVREGPIDGALHVSGRVAGPLSDPLTSATIATDGLEVTGLGAATLQASLRASSAEVVLASLTARAAGGDLSGEGRVNLAPRALPGELTLAWRDLDAGRLIAAVWPGNGPQPDSHLTGSLRGSWTRLRPDALTLNIRNEARSVPGLGRRVALDGSTAIDVRDGHWALDSISRLSEGLELVATAGGRLAPDIGNTTVAGRVTARSPDLARAGRLLASFDAMPVPRDFGLRGHGEISLTVAGTLGGPQFKGTLRAADVGFREFGPATLEASLSVSGRDVHVERFAASEGPNRASGSGRITLDTKELAGHASVEITDLGRFAPLLPRLLQPAGAISFTAQVRGRAAAPQVAATVHGGNLTLAGQRIDSLSASLRLENHAIAADEVELLQGRGRLAASGRYAMDRGTYAVTATGRGLELRPIPSTDPRAEPAALGGFIDLDLEATGSLANPRGRAELAVSGLSVAGLDVGTIRTDIQAAGRTVEVISSVPDLGTTLHGSLGLATPARFTVNVDVDNADLGLALDRLGRPLARPVGGTLSFGLRASGDLDHLPDTTVTLDLHRFEAALDTLPIRLADPARIVYRGAGRSVEAEPLVIGIGRTSLRVAGHLGADPASFLGVRIDGRMEDVRALLALVPQQADSALGSLRAAGDVGIGARIAGSLDRPVVSADARIANGHIEASDLPPVTAIAMQANYRDGVLELQQLGASWQEATLTASGRLPARLLGAYLPQAYVQSLPAVEGGARLKARLVSVTERALASFMAPETLERLTGRLDVSVDLVAGELALDAISGRLTLTDAGLVLAGVALNQRRPTHLELEGGKLRIADWSWGGPTTDLALSGEVALVEHPTFDLTADGRLDLRLLRTFLPEVGTAGQATMRARLTGTPSEPSIDGEIRLAGVGLRVAEPRLALTDLGGTIVLSRDRLTASNLTGNANGGTLKLVGELRYPAFALESGSLSADARGLALAIAGLRTQVDADLSVALGREATTLSGTVTLLRGAYREPLTLSTGLLAALQRQDRATAAEPSAADAIRLDVQLRTAEDLVVDNNYARLQLSTDVRLVGTLDQPALAGRASVREGGQIFLGGNVFRSVGPGSIDFTNPTRIEPAMNLTALTRVGQYDITLSITGTPDRLKTELSSDDPTLGQSDLVSLLTTGRRVGEAGGDWGAVAGTPLLGLLSGELLGGAGRVVGIDTVRVERGRQDLQFDAGLVASDADPGSRLTFGEHVGSKVQLVFSQSLAESGGFTWIVGYSLRPNLLLRVVSLDNGDRSYEFRHDLSFGAPTASRQAAEGEAERVTDVRFLGAPGFSDQELMGELKLTPGDRFDFFRWQSDRDRLEAFYHSRGYREVRINATRSTPGGGAAGRQVSLEYEIHRGPLTRLDVRGYDFRTPIVREMEAAWGRSVFDEFLLEELRALARASLANAGYLRADVTAAVAPRTVPDAKTIVVVVEPGPRTTDRRIVYRGNERLNAARLEAYVASQRLSRLAWVQPDRLAASLTALYRSEGMLAARVNVGGVEFQAGRATLPVTITEDRVFEVEDVTVEGARSWPEPEVRHVFGLFPGDVYSALRVRDARRRLDERYRAGGFHDVVVTVGTTADAATGRVAVAVKVDEGDRQVLRDVVATGAHRTKPELVSRALRLTPGTPVNLHEWYQARKRLYDTGAFRRVDIDVEPIEGGPGEPRTPGVEPVRAKVTLEEVPFLQLRYGVQLNDTYDPLNDARAFSPGFAGDLTAHNLFGRATATGVAFRLTRDFRAGRAFLTSPTFFGLPITSNLFLSTSREDPGDQESRPFVVDRATLTMEQRLRPVRNVQVGYGFSFERNHTFDVNPDPNEPLPFDLTVDVAKLNSTLLFDSRNDLVDPTSGWFVSSNLEFGIGSLGSDLRFVRHLLQQRYYRHIGRGVVVATALRLGLARGFGQEIIPSERFFAGGGNSVRGYATDSLGPRDFFGDPTGGEALLVLNEEIRFPVAWIFRGVAFFDAGNAFSSVGDLSLSGLRSGVGFGLRAQTPFALLRVDFGVPLGRRPGEARGRWFFSIGQAF